MRSIKTTVTAAALVTAGFVLTAPAAHAATAPRADSGGCRSAIAMAQKARHEYNAAVEDLKEQVAAGGHPGTAEEDNVTDLMNKAKAAVWDAVQSCKGEEDRDHHHRRHPHGAMHTGAGSTSQGVSGAELAGGVGILGAAGAGAVALRRRRAGGES